MNKIPLMKCGHSGMATTHDGKPACPICAPDNPYAYEIEDRVLDLSGRKARCTYYGEPTRHNECNYGSEYELVCHCEQPSSPSLPFFEYLGPESVNRLCMYCKRSKEAHQPKTLECPTRYKNSMKLIPGSYNWRGCSYTPIEYKYDRFYCGCHGWN